MEDNKRPVKTRRQDRRTTQTETKTIKNKKQPMKIYMIKQDSRSCASSRVSKGMEKECRRGGKSISVIPLASLVLYPFFLTILIVKFRQRLQAVLRSIYWVCRR